MRLLIAITQDEKLRNPCIYHWIDITDLSISSFSFTINRQTKIDSVFAYRFEKLILRAIHSNYTRSRSDDKLRIKITNIRVISKVCQVLLEFNKPEIFDTQLREEQRTSIKTIEEYKKGIDIKIEDENKQYPLAAKNKKFGEYTILDSNIFATHEVSKISRPVKLGICKTEFFKLALFDSDLPEIEAYMAYLHVLVLGKPHFAKLNAVFKNHIRYATRSRAVSNAETLHNLAKKADDTNLPMATRDAAKVLLSQDSLIKAHLIEALGSAFLLANVDLGPHNIFLCTKPPETKDDKTGVVLFDVDRCLWPLTCIPLGYDPSKPISKEQAAPATAFEITLEDMISFPNVSTFNAYWWLTKENPEYINLLVPYLKDIELNPEAQYRAFRFFLKISLIISYLIQVGADAHIRSEETKKTHVEYVKRRFEIIRQNLKKMPNYGSMLAQNPQIYDEIIQEFEEYNLSINEKNIRFRVNIDEIKTIFQQEHQASSTLIDEEKLLLKRKLEEVKLIIKTTKEYIQQVDPNECTTRADDLLDRQNEIETLIVNWPQNKLAMRTILNKISSILIQVNSLQTLTENKVFNLPHIAKLYELQDKIEIINRFLKLNNNQPLLSDGQKTLQKIILLLSNIAPKSNQEITKLKKDDLIAIRDIENEVETLASKINMKYSFNDLLTVKKVDSEFDKFMLGLDCIESNTISFFQTNYPKKVFAAIKLASLIEVLRTKCNKTMEELQKKDNSDLNVLKLNFILAIESYINTPKEKISVQRLTNCSHILSLINNEDCFKSKELLEELEKYHNSIKTGIGKSSDLIAKIDEALAHSKIQLNPVYRPTLA